ncbi:undecaprenyl pyrophosphate synthetase [Lentilactobacillus farraginis DSM 18382 = JCM 14108]|uniref:Undecaprenyl pyrophosphate synthetase n=1 Tax=Lentilactobacillus farraginis DSM 18382 = JCM 14108 TaxID=1423743 RepID=X0Q989_9LACO|nr:undecaprenyl pyrophosphate synthetase [Lentilactobacillus farraginis DSM 18382 = JCM 14108]
MVFTETLWPDFDGDTLKEMILTYQHRNRRFGGLKNEE